MRRLLFLSLLILALALALPLNWLMGQRRAGPPLPVAPAAGHGARMANLNLAALAGPAVALRLAQMAEDGVSYARLRLPWDEIQPEPDVWRWGKIDRAIAAAREADMSLVLLLDGAPTWAVAPDDAGNPLAPPHDVRDFGRFAAETARRYRGQIAAYQIWDEPNIAPHWGARWTSPRGYFQLLREAANSIRAADPQAQIMLASLAPTTAADGANLSDLRYLDQLYALGAAPYFDITAAAAYGFDQPPEMEPAADRLNFRRPELIFEVMQAHDDAETPVWITAWGWWTPSPGQPPASSPWRGVDLVQLRDYIGRGFRFASVRWPWAGPMAWANYALGPGDDPLRQGFVLRTRSGERTLAGETLVALRDDRRALGTGSHAVDDPAVRAPAWRLSPDAADPNETGAELTASFQGRSIALEIQGGDYWATLRAFIDGKPATLPPKDKNGDAVILLHDPENGVVVVPLATDLAPGSHVLRLAASGGWGQWPLRRIIVDHQPWPKPWPTLPVAAVLLLALGMVAVAWIRVLRAPDGRAGMAGLDAAWTSASAWVQDRAGDWLLLGLAVLALILYLTPWLWLSLLAVGLLALSLALRLDLAPPLALILLPFYLRPKVFGSIGLSLHELVLWLAFALWLGRWFVAWRGDDARRGDPVLFKPAGLDVPLLLLLLVGLFATINAGRFGFALYDFRTVFLTPALFYWLVVRAAPERPLNLNLLGDALVLGALLLSLAGLRQFISGGAYFVEGVPRVYALFGSANNVALYLGRVLPLLVAVIALGAAPRRWLYLAAGLPIAFVAFLSFSKGLLLISAPAGLVMLALLEARLRRPAIFLLALGALALVPFLGAARFTGLFNVSGGTTFLRLQLWQSAWRMFLDHPLLGVGPDNFLYAYRSVYALPAAWEELQLSHPHNLFLDLLTRTGALGFVVGLWLLGATLWRGLRLLRRLSALDYPLYLGLLVGLAAGLLHGLIDNSIFLVDLAVLTLLVVAATQRLGRDWAGRDRLKIEE